MSRLRRFPGRLCPAPRALSPPQLNAPSLPSPMKAKDTPNPKQTNCFPPPPTPGVWAGDYPNSCRCAPPFLVLPRASWLLMSFLFPSPGARVTSTSPVSLPEPTRRPSPLLSSGAGLRGAFRIPSQHQEREAQPALPPALHWGGHQGPPSPATGHHAGTARSRECWLPGWGWGRGDSSWVPVAQRDWGDGGCAAGCIPRPARRGEPLDAFCYSVAGG